MKTNGFTSSEIEDFEDIAEKSILAITNNKSIRTTLNHKNFEQVVCDTLNTYSKRTIFDNKFELISGGAFPDIVATIDNNKKLGVEVKTTSSKHLQSIGSSINESTRVENVQKIYIFFARLSTNFKIICRPYDQVMTDIKVTHFPRYFIDMAARPSDTIFHKMRVSYEEFSKNENGLKYQILKDYYRTKLKPGDNLWWLESIDGHNPDVYSDSITAKKIRLFKDASPELKDNLISQTYILFPEIFSNRQDKFKRAVLWIAGGHGLVSPNFRDEFSAGGQITVNGVKFSKIFEYVFNNKNRLKDIFDENKNKNDFLYYWKPIDPKASLKGVSFKGWKSLVLGFANLNEAQKKVFRNELN